MFNLLWKWFKNDYNKIKLIEMNFILKQNFNFDIKEKYWLRIQLRIYHNLRFHYYKKYSIHGHSFDNIQWCLWNKYNKSETKLINNKRYLSNHWFNFNRFSFNFHWSSLSFIKLSQINFFDIILNKEQLWSNLLKVIW